MTQLVTSGATTRCTLGVTPGTLVAVPGGVNAGPAPLATVTDFAPFANITPFGMCLSLFNPAVASATAAAMGVLAPMPCTPVIRGPWQPGSPTMQGQGRPARTDGSTWQCAYGGLISSVCPGQFTGGAG